jgi:hypothetical protein
MQEQRNGNGIGFRFRSFGILTIGLIFFTSIAQSQTTVLSIETLAHQISSPEALAKFMKHNFKYAPDRRLFHEDEYWQSPEEMLERRQGDCEDYALFAKAILEQNGMSASVVSVYWAADAHTVAVFEQNGKWGIFDLADLHYVDAATMADLAKTIRHDWHYLGIMRQEGRIGIISRKFKRD